MSREAIPGLRPEWRKHVPKNKLRDLVSVVQLAEYIRRMENEQWHHMPMGNLKGEVYLMIGHLMKNLAEES